VNIDSVLAFIQSFLAGRGLGQFSHAASLWVFFAACGVTELAISFLICTPLERFWPLTRWPKRNPIAADVTYAFFVRIVLFPLIAYFEFNWLRQSLDGFLRGHGIAPPSLSGLIPVLASWPALVFVANFAVLDLADYWRHRVSHRIGWWYGIHSLHHAEEQLTFWSDDRSHVLEDAITYVWLIAVGLAIGVPSMQFPFLILCFRFLGSISHENTRVGYGWQPIAASVRQRVHKRMLAYDEMTVHPDIGFYGNADNREWKQYALPDDNEPEAAACPFQTRANHASL